MRFFFVGLGKLQLFKICFSSSPRMQHSKRRVVCGITFLFDYFNGLSKFLRVCDVFFYHALFKIVCTRAFNPHSAWKIGGKKTPKLFQGGVYSNLKCVLSSVCCR